MASGFKNSLFGFKKRDVLSYIEQAQKKSAEKEAELLKEITALKAENSTLKDDIKALNEEKERLENIQEEYIKRYNEVEKMSEDIGKLYLTAQTNAKEIVEQSLKERELIDKEIEDNLTAIEEMHASLDSVKKDVVSSAGEFSLELEKLFQKFNEAKAKFKESSIVE